MKTVSDRDKTAAVERIFRKVFKKEKIDVDEKKKENNADFNYALNKQN